MVAPRGLRPLLIRAATPADLTEWLTTVREREDFETFRCIGNVEYFIQSGALAEQLEAQPGGPDG
jgi:hypothetical protein